jgi:hypothetical protein
MAWRAGISDPDDRRGDVFENANDLEAVVVVLLVALMMVVVGVAKKQLVWRPRKHWRQSCMPIRRRRRRRR